MAAEAKQLKSLKTLIAQRQIEVLKITELKSVADNALQDNSAHNIFYCRFKHIEPIKATFDKYQDDIISIISVLDSGDLAPHHEVLMDFEDMYYHCEDKVTQVNTSVSSIKHV